MSKEVQYRELIADVRAAYQHDNRELKWCDDCQEINLWAYWQGRGHLDARLMLVGQDWGCPWDDAASQVMQNIRDMNRGKNTSYMTGHKNPTDNNLIELFRFLGFDILRDQKDLFFTNLVLGYRTKGISGNFQQIWAEEDKEYFRRLVEIIRPQVLLCLGRDTWRNTLACFGALIPQITSYNAFIESEQNPIRMQLQDGTPSHVFALAHCGALGTLNRNRGRKYIDKLDIQKEDWDRIRPFLSKI